MKCLAWMIYARRPLGTHELQYALAVSERCTDLHDLQFDSPQVILEACANLLEEGNGTIRPIHYTVQEFLTTTAQGLSQQAIRAQLLHSESVHARLSLVCLTYMHLVAFSEPAEDALDLAYRLIDNTFAGYSYQNFDYHISRCDGIPPNVMGQLENLFQHESSYLASVLQIKVLRDGHDHDTVLQHFNRIQFPVSASTMIYSTSLYNIPNIRERWLGSTTPKYALQLAATTGLASAIIQLLDEGHNVNEKDESGSTSLYHACFNNELEIIKILIEKGANINAQGGYFGNALQAASHGGHEAVVKLLLDKGADVNAQGGEFNNALYTASYRGHEAIVELLVEKGADVNAQGGEYGNALQVVSLGGYEAVVKLLLDKGANINAQGGYFGNALQAASLEGYEAVAKLLLDKGADINAQGGHFGNALCAASLGGYEAVAKLLLDKGADVNAQGGKYSNALCAASLGGYETIMKLLLERGADVNAQGGEYSNALQAASYRSHEAVVKLLLEKGADPPLEKRHVPVSD